SPANAMTTIYTEQSNEIRKVLKEQFNVNIAGGQDHLKGKIFRVNHMGLVEDFEAAWAVNAIEKALDVIGTRTFDGTANKVFMEINCD
ncbi:MAG: alanine--glyoxylate aminotransferase family protein, partial [Campylobacteraceae bacterium]|nr:alanine--glyoxylate aminotransferase family protein [Campylobacteraceae bacterium]MBT7116923.1 alanine--glyoxylate aminotransferase family protein [Campylobacteraceae bacterium]